MDKFCRHEFLDRSSIIFEMFQISISDHSEYENLPQDIKDDIEKIQVSMYKLYQKFAEFSLEDDNLSEPKKKFEDTFKLSTAIKNGIEK